MKNFILPFYKDRHTFLLQKWWFRLAVLLYVVGIFSLIVIMFFYFMDAYLRCYSTVTTLFEWGTEVYKQEFAHCQQAVREVIPLAAGGAVATVVAIHYLFQFLFFAVFMDFVVLGTRFSRHRD